MQRVLPILVILAAVAAGAVPAARGQVRACANLDRLNRRLAGQVVDYSHNHGADRRPFSPILGMPRDLYVYLPPGYSPARAYPLVLYFHPSYVDENIFTARAWIGELDRMIARGEFPPAVVAAVDGTTTGENRFRAPHSLFVNGCGGRVEDHVLFEVLPFLMRTYSIRPERQAHALLGTSAGGFGALSLAIRRRDLFGAGAVVGGAVNLRYSNLQGRYADDFQPETYRWKDRYDPDEVVGVFSGGLSRTRARKYMEPVFGCRRPGVEAAIAAVNPADLLFTTDLRPGELALYINYAARDNWNFDAQAESFAWLASTRGIAVDLERVPRARHNVRYFRTQHPRAYRWLAAHLLPPTAP